MLLHFDEPFLREAEAEEAAGSGEKIDRKINLMDWYVRWAQGCVGGALLVLPESARARWAARAEALSGNRVLWYDAEGRLAGEETPGAAGLWLIHGGLFPIVNWDAAEEAAERHRCDVLVFGPPGSVSSAQYPESLVVDASGRVLKVERHYFDSPAFTDVAYGPISFCYVTGDRRAACCAHLLRRGWSLESIRALAQAAAVEWCAAPSVLSSMAGAAWRKSQEGRGAGESGSGRIRRSGGGTAVAERDVESAERRSNGKSPSSAGGSEPSSPRESGESGGRWSAAWGDLLSAQAILEAPQQGLYPYVKRGIDIVFSLGALIVTLPLFVVIAILVKRSSPGPIFYADLRQGKGGKEFRCYKFRTMVADAADRQAELRQYNEVDGPQFKMANDPRLTPIGRWLRKYNVDELPQFINVLLGQMSLVGPRPSPDRENQLCPGWRRTRLSLRPGITGLWQVLRLRRAGPSDFQEWIYYDLEYARHRSFRLDCLIVAYTPFTVWKTHKLANLARRLAKQGICVEADAMHRQHGEAS